MAKCNVFFITKKKTRTSCPYILHGQALEEVASSIYLAVTISNNMSWNKLIDKTTSKANIKLKFLKSNLTVKYQKLKEKAYTALFRPTLEYCGGPPQPRTSMKL